MKKKKSKKSKNVLKNHENEKLWNFSIYTKLFYNEKRLSKLCEKSRKTTTFTNYSREINESCISIIDSNQTKLHNFLLLFSRTRKIRLTLDNQQFLKSKSISIENNINNQSHFDFVKIVKNQFLNKINFDFSQIIKKINRWTLDKLFWLIWY